MQACRWLHGLPDSASMDGRRRRVLRPRNIHAWLHGEPAIGRPAEDDQNSFAKCSHQKNLEPQTADKENTCAAEASATVTDLTISDPAACSIEVKPETVAVEVESPDTSEDVEDEEFQVPPPVHQVRVAVIGDSDHRSFRVTVDCGAERDGYGSVESIKRFNDFHSFYQRVTQEIMPSSISFPPKLMWHTEIQIEERRKELEAFITDLLTRPMSDELWSDVQAFLGVGPTEVPTELPTELTTELTTEEQNDAVEKDEFVLV